MAKALRLEQKGRGQCGNLRNLGAAIEGRAGRLHHSAAVGWQEEEAE